MQMNPCAYTHILQSAAALRSKEPVCGGYEKFELGNNSKPKLLAFTVFEFSWRELHYESAAKWRWSLQAQAATHSFCMR